MSAARLPVPVAAVVVLLSVAGCTDDAGDAAGYRVTNREAFVAACTDPAVDDRVVRDVCECTYDRIEESLPYEQFVELEESLRIDSLIPLPDEVSDLVAECFLTEADL
jgi:hypothetical protein